MRSNLYFVALLLLCGCSGGASQCECGGCASSFTNVVYGDYSPSQESEFSPAKTIIVHEPAGEILPGMLHPRAALFDVYFNINESQREHRQYVEQLRGCGAEVINVREALMSGCFDDNGVRVESEELEELREFAERVLIYDTSLLPESQRAEQEAYKSEVVSQLSVEELVDVLIMQPRIVLSPTEYNTGITATYEYNPLMNLFYTRDQMITTAKGIVMSRMNSPQRQNEVEIMKFVLHKLSVEPIYEVAGEGAYLEGGDLISYPNTTFMGCGMRTTRTAIDQLLKGDLYGTDSVVVVYDRRFSQAEMHLDTYFNIIDSDLATMSEARLTDDSESMFYLEADVYVRVKEGDYQLVNHLCSFVDLLQNDLGMTLIPIPESDQARMAGNYLTVAPRKIMAVANQSDEYVAKLEANGVEVEWIELENLIKGYGAAHCMTQVIERSK